MPRSAKKTKNPFYLVAGAVALLLLASILSPLLRKARPALSEREDSARSLAATLARAVKPKSVLILGNPYSLLPGRPREIYQFENASLNGLRAGFPPGVQVNVAHPRLKPEALSDPGSVLVDPGTTTPLSFLVAENAFDEAIQAHPNTDLVISLIGLPVNLAALSAWNTPGKPAFALLLPDWRVIGDAAAIQRAFDSGKLAAATIENPSASPKTPAPLPGRFLLATPANLAGLLRDHPNLFTR